VGRDARYLSVATNNAISGALEKSTARLSIFGQRGGASSNAFATSDVLEFGDNGAPGGHPVPRSGDGYVALDLASGSDVDIQSITYPGETAEDPPRRDGSRWAGRAGTNSFRWNLRVNGKRLKPGTYLLTYRALKRNKVLNTSDSIRFTVTKSGKIRNPRRQR
jgi:hypothetical protein